MTEAGAPVTTTDNSIALITDTSTSNIFADASYPYTVTLEIVPKAENEGEVITEEFSTIQNGFIMEFSETPIASWNDCKNYDFYVEVENASGSLIPETKLVDISEEWAGIPFYSGPEDSDIQMQLIVCADPSSSPTFIYGYLNFAASTITEADCPLTVTVRIVPKESGGG